MRAQTNDLQERGESVIRPEARAQNRWYNARPPRAERLQIQGFTQGLSTAFTVIEGVEADQQQQAGVLVAQEKIAEAEKASGKNALAAARLVAKGQLDETENPYFRTGYARTIAQNIASRWQTTAEAEIRRAYAETPLGITTEAGVPSQSPDAAAITQGKLDEFFQAIGESNPGLADDPWFKREFSKQRARVESNLFDLGFKLSEQRLAEENRQAKSVQLHDYLIRELGNGGGDLDEINRWTKQNIVAGGIKDWKEFSFNVIDAAADSILGTKFDASGRELTELERANRAADFVQRAGEYQTGKSKLRTDIRTAGNYLRLARRMEVAVARAEGKADDEAQKMRAKFAREFPESETFQNLLRFDSSTAALSHVQSMRDALFAGTVPGVPKGMGTEAYMKMRNAAARIGEQGAEETLAKIQLSLDDGDLREARFLIDSGSLPPQQLVKAEQAFREYEALSHQYFDANPEVENIGRNLRIVSENLMRRESGASQALGLSISDRQRALYRKHRAAIKALPDEQAKFNYVNSEALPEILEFNESVQEQVSKQKADFDATLFEVEGHISTGADASGLIRSLRAAGRIGGDTAAKLQAINKGVQKELNESRGASKIQGIIRDVSNNLKGLGFSAPSGNSYVQPSSGEKSVLTPDGLDVLRKAESLIAGQISEYFRGEESPLRKIEGGPEAAKVLIPFEAEKLRTWARWNLEEAIIDNKSWEEIQEMNLIAPAKDVMPKRHPEPSFDDPEIAPEKRVANEQSAASLSVGQKITNLIESYGTERKGPRGEDMFKHRTMRDDEMPDVRYIQMSYPQEVADDISMTFQDVFKKNAFIDRVVGAEAMRSTFGFQESFIPRGLAHPYPLQFEIVRRHHKGVENAERWEEYARENNLKVVRKALETEGLSQPQQFEIAVRSHTFLGLDYQGILGGRLETFGHDVLVDDLSKNAMLRIPWRVMPLFRDWNDLKATREEDMDKLFDLLGITTEDQELEFLGLQKAALERLKRA